METIANNKVATIEEFVSKFESLRTRDERKTFVETNVKVTELLEYDDFVDDAWFYLPQQNGNMPELGYVALKLTGESGELAEKIAKAYRDHDGSVQDRDALLKELGDALFYITKLSHLLGGNLETVAKMNVAKIQDRKQRGTLRGSGDNR